MNLEHEFTYVATLKPPVGIGAGPFGTRNFFENTGGTVEGKRLKGKVLAGGGDWLLIGPDGYARLDVRAQLLTHDGASLYVQFNGLLQMNQKVTDALAKGASTDYGDQYFRTTPRFETGDQRIRGSTRACSSLRGASVPAASSIQVYRVA